MSHSHPPSDLEDAIHLSKLSPETQARVRALLRPPVNPPAPVPDITLSQPLSQSSDKVQRECPGYNAPANTRATNVGPTQGPSQRNQSGSQFTYPQMLQTQKDHTPMGRENTPNSPLTTSSFQPPRPSFPWMHAAPTPLATAATPATPTSDLPTPPLPTFQLPAITGLRPSPAERFGSMVPSAVQKRKTGLKSASANARKKQKGGKGQAIAVEESAQDTDEHAVDELTGLIQDLKSDLATFRVDLPTPFVVAAEGEVKGDPALVIRSLGQYMTDQMALVRGGLLVLATQVSSMEERLKTPRKVPRGERSDQENEAHRYIKLEIHTTVQGLLHWKPSDGFGTLPNGGDMYQDGDSGDGVEISAPHWDERIDTTSNLTWMANVTTLIEGKINAEIEGNDPLKETLQGISIRKYIEEALKGYIRHLKVNWAKAITDPSRMKRDYRRGRRIARQREESLRAIRMLGSLNVIVARSPDIFSEEESGPEDDTPGVIQEFAEHGKPLQVGEFYLTHSKPYLSSAATDLKTLARMIYKSHQVRPTNSKIRIEGPTSNLLPPDSKLENWMVDADWAPAGGPVTCTFLKDSVPSDQIGAIMNDGIHTWNSSSQISAIGHGGEDEGSESNGSTNLGERGSRLNSGRAAWYGTDESEKQ